MLKQRHILLPYLIVSVLLLIGASFFFYDSHAIIDAEEDEEENGKILLYSESYLSALQQTEIEQHHFLMTGKERYQVSFWREREHAVNRLAELRKALAEHYLDSVPKVDAAARIQERYFKELDRIISEQADRRQNLERIMDSERSSTHLLQIQLLLEQLAADVYENRTRINENVSFSVKRAGISVTSMAAILIAILAFGYRLTSRTLSANQSLAEKLRHEATHDALTHLPNRRYFTDWIHHSIALALRKNFSVGLFFIDLDGFKQINDRYGHDAGDKVLQLTAKRFQALMRESDLLARLGGDEFAILVSQAPGNDELSALAARIIASLDEPVIEGEAEARIGASIGIAAYPRDAGDVNALMSAADEAMYQAKGKGKNQYVFFKSLA